MRALSAGGGRKLSLRLLTRFPLRATFWPLALNLCTCLCKSAPIVDQTRQRDASFASAWLASGSSASATSPLQRAHQIESGPSLFLFFTENSFHKQLAPFVADQLERLGLVSAKNAPTSWPKQLKSRRMQTSWQTWNESRLGKVQALHISTYEMSWDEMKWNESTPYLARKCPSADPNIAMVLRAQMSPLWIITNANGFWLAKL